MENNIIDQMLDSYIIENNLQDSFYLSNDFKKKDWRLNRLLELTKDQFDKVTDKIKNCQILRDDREYNLERSGKAKTSNEDIYDTDKKLRLWLDIESELENFLEKLGYEFSDHVDRYIYQKRELQ